MKRAVALLVFGILFPNLSAVAETAPKPGSACTKLGATKTYQGKKFTCIKSGKKLVWNKGVTAAKPTESPVPSFSQSAVPSVTPSPTPAPTPSPAPTPTPTPKELTFSNITENIDSIAINVFSQYERLMKTSYQSVLSVKVFIGSNTTPQTSNPTSAFLIASKLLQNFKQPEEVSAIYYTFADKEWGKKKVQELDGSSRWDYQFGYQCLEERSCQGASAGVTQSWMGIGHFGVNNFNRRLILNNEREMHEFVHMVCAFQLKPNWGDYYRLTPDWFSEGHANLIGTLGGAKTLTEYKASRIEDISKMRPDSILKNYQVENILRFYDAFLATNSTNGMSRDYLYTLGWSTIETLAAIGGIDSPMNLYLETVKGSTFKQAFKNTYGLEWEVAAPILADVVSQQFRVFYP